MNNKFRFLITEKIAKREKVNLYDNEQVKSKLAGKTKFIELEQYEKLREPKDVINIHGVSFYTAVKDICTNGIERLRIT